MQTYLAAHDALVAWLDSLEAASSPAPAEVERRLWALALQAADRGMTSTHWTFVVDGLVSYVNRRAPGDLLLSSYVARGFDLCSRWSTVRIAAASRHSDVFEHRSIG
ncbi:MAG: hypothetical protein ABW186_03085 [Rhodanobacteraceae bacterium]